MSTQIPVTIPVVRSRRLFGAPIPDNEVPGFHLPDFLDPNIIGHAGESNMGAPGARVREGLMGVGPGPTIPATETILAPKGKTFDRASGQFKDTPPPAAQAAGQAAASAPGGKNPSHPNEAPPPPKQRPYRGTFHMSGDSWNPSGAPLSQGQLEQDFRAHEAINSRNRQAMESIEEQDAERGDPMAKKIEGEARNAAYERLMPVPTEAASIQKGPDGVFRNAQPPLRRGEDLNLRLKQQDIAERGKIMENVQLAAQNLMDAEKSGNADLIRQAQRTYDVVQEMAKMRLTGMADKNLGFYGQPDFGTTVVAPSPAR